MTASLHKISLSISTGIDKPLIELFAESLPQITITEKEYLTLKHGVGYWQALHKKAIEREEISKQTIKELEGEIRGLKSRLFGNSNEQGKSKNNEGQSVPSPSPRPRGQQPGTKGHGRTPRPNLPEKEELIDFEETPQCEKCGTSYVQDENQEIEIIEVEVKAYTRKNIRVCMKKNCSCKGIPNTIIAGSAPPQLIKRSPYGISVWEAILLNKFHYSQPTNRLLNQYNEMGLPISPGTIAGGLKILKELFQPVYDALYAQQMTENRFHNDESGWKVFENIEGKIGNRWWLWLSRSPSVIYFEIAPGRGANVPLAHFQNIQHDKIIIVCDRYSAYKSLAKQLDFIILAFCWAHVRRDFLDAAKKHPDLEKWAFSWIGKIAELYHINNLRCDQFDPKLPVPWQPAPFKEHHEILVEKMDEVAKDRDAFIEANNPENPESTLLTNIQYKILTSLQNHWQGLSVFVDYPEVPMDNNKAERSIRNPVTGRNAFYGSGSLWSSQLAAIMFSVFQTIALAGLNCSHWLRMYLTACAENNGQAPADLSPFLPWKMDEDRRQQLSKPPPDTS